MLDVQSVVLIVFVRYVPKLKSVVASRKDVRGPSKR
jgi:hypothetical protein